MCNTYQWTGFTMTRNERVNILNDFLINMKQSVALNGYCLSWVDIGAGLPRGSIPGPLLFLTCPSDLPKYLISERKLFADDIIIFHSS